MPPVNIQPYEIIGAPLTLYLGVVGEAEFPDLTDDEEDFVGTDEGEWFKVGTAGTRSYAEEGVTVNHEVTMNYVRGAGSTLPRKAFITEEDFWIGITLNDLSTEQYARIMNDAEVTVTAPGATQHGEKNFSLVRGLIPASYALLARGVSPEHGEGAAQYEVDSVVSDGSSAVTFTKGEPAQLVAEYRTIDASGEGSGIEHRVYTDDPTGP